MHKLLPGGVAALLVLAAPASAFAEDLTFTLTNASSFTVARFFTSPADVAEWEEDVFGDGVLPSGNTVDVTIGDGRDTCTYDMKFVMEDGTELLEEGIDLCSLGEYTLSDAE